MNEPRIETAVYAVYPSGHARSTNPERDVFVATVERVDALNDLWTVRRGTQHLTRGGVWMSVPRLHNATETERTACTYSRDRALELAVAHIDDLRVGRLTLAELDAAAGTAG